MTCTAWTLAALMWSVACDTGVAAPPVAADEVHDAAHRTAVFAGGCFWCMEADFEKLPGVVAAVSGYAGGSEKNPTYAQVSSGRTGHTESVRVVYDASKLTYAELVTFFFRHIDPTQANGQFCDQGRQYRSAVFVTSAEEKKTAERIVADVAKQLSAPVVTEIVEGATFWPAETYHQDYARQNPGSYGSYRLGCGRDARVRALWSATRPSAAGPGGHATAP